MGQGALRTPVERGQVVLMYSVLVMIKSFQDLEAALRHAHMVDNGLHFFFLIGNDITLLTLEGESCSD